MINDNLFFLAANLVLAAILLKPAAKNLDANFPNLSKTTTSARRRPRMI